MSAHSPGPWTAIKRAGWSITSSSPLRALGSVCCIPASVSRPAIESEANAHLIAAAPVLLEALCNIEMWIATQPEAVRTLPPIECALSAARAAIAKAAGEPS